MLHLLVLALDRLLFGLALTGRGTVTVFTPTGAIGPVPVAAARGGLVGLRADPLEHLGELPLRRIDGALVLALERLANGLDACVDLGLVLSDILSSRSRSSRSPW